MKNIWWGEFPFEEQSQKCWNVGERSIVIMRQATEWNTWNVETDEENYDDIVISNKVNDVLIEDSNNGRFLEKNTSNKLNVMPLLADRTVVARPSSPLTILAGEKIQLFVSTPIWFYAETSPGGKCLLDIPFWRPSDSWFGASTIDGQLCYAKYTSAKTQLDELNLHSHRATTPITVINSHKKSLTINRINVPVNYLNLYCDENNNLWSSIISIERENDSDDVELIIDKSSSDDINPLTFISKPRLSSEQGKLVRSISHLFG